MLVDYTKMVLACYHNKKHLSHNLKLPTCARLREECITVCRDRYDKKDDGALNPFFKGGGEKEKYLKAIEKVEIEDLKPLLYYINGKTKGPDISVVELVAWLVDFQPRPYELGRKYGPLTTLISSGPMSNTPEKAEKSEIPVKPAILVQANSGKPYSRLRFNTGIGAAILVIASCMFAFFSFTGPQSCMYWTGDHYEKIDCNKKTNQLTIALDSERLTHFRKITRPDTITYISKGYVWYSKMDNNIEFFTAGGNHPTAIYNKLRPISDYIIKKYCLPPQ